MLFQKRHYEAVAKVLEGVQPHSQEDTFNATVAAFAQMFACDNPNFKRAKFGLACGLTLPIGD